MRVLADWRLERTACAAQLPSRENRFCTKTPTEAMKLPRSKRSERDVTLLSQGRPRQQASAGLSTVHRYLLAMRTNLACAAGAAAVAVAGHTSTCSAFSLHPAAISRSVGEGYLTAASCASSPGIVSAVICNPTPPHPSGPRRLCGVLHMGAKERPKLSYC